MQNHTNNITVVIIKMSKTNTYDFYNNKTPTENYINKKLVYIITSLPRDIMYYA